MTHTGGTALTACFDQTDVSRFRGFLSCRQDLEVVWTPQSDNLDGFLLLGSRHGLHTMVVVPSKMKIVLRRR